MQQKDKKNGFSLLEILVAITIMAGISIVLAQSLFTANRTSIKTDVNTTVKQGGDFSLRIMEQFIRSATDITSTCEATGTVSNSVQITNRDQGSTTFSCVYDSTNAITRIASISGAVTEYLTPASMTLGGASCNGITIFTCTAAPGVPKKVRINFTLAQKQVSPDSFENASVRFDSSIALRN